MTFAKSPRVRLIGTLIALVTSFGVFGCSSAPAPDELNDSTHLALTSPVYQINSGEGSVAPYVVDQYVSGGTTYTYPSSVVVSTSGVANAAPAAVYQSERYGNFTYTFPNLTPNASYVVRLHFSESMATRNGQRLFNVSINGTRVLTNFDIYALAGFNKALVRDLNATATSAGQIKIQYVNVADNAKSSAIEILSTSDSSPPPASNAAPTVAQAATANPNPTTGSTSALSVLGDDDGGEANLTYTWSTVGTPPAPVSFSANGTNAAKSVTATFTQSGAYSLSVLIRDAAGASVTSAVTVTVPDAVPSDSQAPAQVGVAYQINSGGSAVSPFAADQYVSGGTTYTYPSSTVVSTSGVTNAAPAGVYQSERYGNFSYTFPSLTPNANYVVRLHFSESMATRNGQRLFNVSINGARALTNFDIYALAGFNKALVRDLNATATSAGQIKIDYVNVADNAKSSGIEILSTSGSAPPSNASPTVAQAATGNPNPTSGGTSALSVLGADDGGEGNLTYTWSAVGTPPAPVSFSANGTNAAKNVTATFTQSGNYSLSVSIRDAAGASVTSGVTLTVSTASGATNQAPTIATAASANPNPTTGKSSSLSVLGADDGGEANLIYIWATAGSPPGAVSFSTNGTNAAKNITATFTSAGNYSLTVTVRDAAGLTATSNVAVAVSQKLTSIGVTPGSAQVAAGSKQQFLASAKDQFGTALSPQPSIAWSVSGGGSIDSVGQFTAGSSSGGPFTVSATNGSVSGTASVSVSGGSGGYSTTFDINESPISDGGNWTKKSQGWTRIITSGGLAYGTQSGNGGFDDSYAYLTGSYPANQSATAVIHLESGIQATYQEVEILLRWTDSANTSIGYECNLAYNGQYAEIIKWPGPFATQTSQFKFISSGNPVSGGVHDGDVFQADVVGNVITSRLNGRVIATGVDSSITSGAPGMGFYSQGAPASQKFSFTSFSATGL